MPHIPELDAPGTRQRLLERVEDLAQEGWTLLATHQQDVRAHPSESSEGGVHLFDKQPVEALQGDERLHGDAGRFDPPLLPPEVQRDERLEQPPRQKGWY